MLFDLKNDFVHKKTRLLKVSVFGYVQNPYKKKNKEKLYIYKFSPFQLQSMYFPSLIIDEKFNIVAFEFYDGSRTYKCSK